MGNEYANHCRCRGRSVKIGGVFNGQKTGFYGWWIVAGCFLLTFTGIGIAINSIGVFLKPVTESLGFDRGEFSLYFTIAALSMALAAPFMGKLLSKYNIRVVMGIATTLLALSFFLYSQSTQLIHFYLLSIVLGIGSAGTHVIPVALLITNWFKRKKRRGHSHCPGRQRHRGYAV